MEASVKARIEAAPPKILAQVTQAMIDQNRSRPFHIFHNPVVDALKAAGFREVSVSVFNAFIGEPDGLVGYAPDTATMAKMDNWRKRKVMTPFIACFHKKGIE